MDSMVGRWTAEDLEIALVALLDETGYDNAEIAALIGKSLATVTRRLREAKERRWLTARTMFTGPAELRTESPALLPDRDLVDRLRQDPDFARIERIVAVPMPSRRGRLSTPDRLARIGRFYAPYLSAYLSTGAHVVGLHFGSSVRALVENLAASPNAQTLFFPLIGIISMSPDNPFHRIAYETGANHLARIAADRTSGLDAARLSTPAFIPREFADRPHELEVIWKFLHADRSYATVFGPDARDHAGRSVTPLIDAADTVITGVGGLESEGSFLRLSGLVTAEDRPCLEARGVIGDLGTHLVTEDGIVEPSTDPDDEVGQLNALVVGASPHHLIACAQRRRQSGEGLGAVVLTTGEAKSRVLITAARLGAISELVTDAMTLKSILRVLGR
jgi:DNA-binding transcriptional regulator LsrR (DeoR family)